MNSKILILALATIANSNVPDSAINIKSTESMSFKPNRASFDISISCSNLDPDSTIICIKPKIDTIETIFKNHNLNSKNVQIKEMNINEHYSFPKDKKRILEYYTATRAYSINTPYIDSITNLIVDLKLAGVNNISSIEFSNTNYDSLSNIVLKAAIEKTKVTAQSIATQYNLVLGPPRVISNERPLEFQYENHVNINFSFGQEPIMTQQGTGGRNIKGAASGRPSTPERIKAWKQFFKIEIDEINISNQIWVTYPILSGK